MGTRRPTRTSERSTGGLLRNLKPLASRVPSPSTSLTMQASQRDVANRTGILSSTWSSYPFGSPELLPFIRATKLRWRIFLGTGMNIS